MKRILLLFALLSVGFISAQEQTQHYNLDGSLAEEIEYQVGREISRKTYN